ILKLFARGDIHERADQSFSRAVVVAKDDRALENVYEGAITAAKTVFAAPTIVRTGEGIADGCFDAGAIAGMNIFLPELNTFFRNRSVVAEKRFETLRPGKSIVF